MKTIALTTAALLVAAGSAFAASDHFQAPSGDQPAANIDSTYTSSVKPNVLINEPAANPAAQEHRDRWGN